MPSSACRRGRLRYLTVKKAKCADCSFTQGADVSLVGHAVAGSGTWDVVEGGSIGRDSSD